MRFSLTHRLVLPLDAAPRAVQHVLLTALPTPQQLVERWSIDMPGMERAASFRDGFGNMAQLVTQVKPGDSLAVTVTGAVETVDRAGVLGRLPYEPPPAVFARPTELTPADEDLIAGVTAAGGRIALLHELMGRLHDRTTPSQAQDASGQSQSPGTQDAAALVHAFIGGARAFDIPARYVTGYLCEDGAARTHAWAEAWDGGLGWIGFDPLLNLCPAEGHIRLAAALDAGGATPIRMIPAATGDPAETLEIAVEG